MVHRGQGLQQGQLSPETRHLSSVFCNSNRGFHGLRFIPGMKSARPGAQRLPALPGVSAPSDKAQGPPFPDTVTEAQAAGQPGDATWRLPWPHMSCGRGTCRLQERERDCVPGGSARRLRLPGAPALRKVQAGRLWLTTRGGGRVCRDQPPPHHQPRPDGLRVLRRGSHGPPAGRRPCQSPGEEGVTLSSERD